ncbi:hypothetical protein GCM10010218_41310 [Streptomyces mashuensis]|uniref:Gamma-soluble NSF attachment protein n=1 Tax=Streptomyces mashuensis TaxID=33904 RepID=A0A919EE90_9ACTN|nr:tetratricopeptide repeat protein [Streptomyces mashuensis]GHF55520.1 hypothetical protein GCM10010218_41310 [Streptomyces mashuensis]
MLETKEAVFDALRENNDRPYGRRRTVVAEELVEAAGQFPENDLLVTALLELMEAYEFSGEHRHSPVVFARILKLWDTDRGAFSEWEAKQVLWRFKWVTTSLLQVPDVPLTAIDGWLAQMDERYRAAGQGRQPVAAMRYAVARHTGHGLAHAYDAWATRPREELSDCEACEIRQRALFHAGTGDDARALETWRPVLEGTAGCTEEPCTSQAKALLPLLRLGRTDEARSHHLAGYRAARGRTATADEIGRHLEFCALTHNEARGLEILAENRELFTVTGAPLNRLHFLTGTEVLLRRLAAQGHAGAATAGPAGRTWTVGDLLDHVHAEADALAAAFDTRNGSTWVGDRRRERLAREPLLAEPLPLGLRATALLLAPAPAPAPQAPVPDDFATLLEQARAMDAQGHPGAKRLWRRVADIVTAPGHVHDPALGPAERLSAELAEQRGFAAFHAERHDDARAAMTEAAELFARAGMPWHAVVARARAACRPATASGGEPDWAALATALPEAGELLAAGVPGVEHDNTPQEHYLAVLVCHLSAAHTALLAELPDVTPATRERFESAAATVLAEAGRLGVAHTPAVAHQYLADVAAYTGRFDEAEARLRSAVQVAETAGRPWRAANARGLLGQVLLQQDRPQEAADELRQALSTAARHDDTDFPVARTHILLGHACAHSGDVAGAVRHLSEAAARLDREDEPESAAETRLQLADVLSRADQWADAVAVLESLLTDDAAASLPAPLAAQIRLDLARGLTELEEYRASAEEFLRLADTVAGWEDGTTHTLVAAEAAVALARAGSWDAARTAYERAVTAHGAAANPGPVLSMMCQFAALTTAAQGPDGLDAALAHLAEADRLRLSVPAGEEGFAAWYHEGATHYRRARTLAVAERFAEALAEMERAVTAYEAGGPQAEAPRAEAVRVAALIEGNGLHAVPAATARLTAAIARCEAAGLPEAVAILTSLREDLASRQE